MSGILALLHRGALESGGGTEAEASFSPDLLARLTRSMAYRAPEGTATWQEGSVGLGFALLRTHTPGEQAEAGVVRDQAAGLAIVADARLDGREDLVRELRKAGMGRGAGRPLTPDLLAPELLLAAYRVWGEECPERLLGDFAFVLWDAPRRTLLAARDAFGVKPLFVAELGEGKGSEAGWVLLSNTLPTVLEHPAVSWGPDEASLGDYLLFGGIQDEVRTWFAEVRQVPRGSILAWGPGGRRARSFWSLPEPGEIRYRRSRDYTEHFGVLLHQAVSDRLPEPGRVGVIELSGGLDSGTLACAAVEVRTGRPAGPRAGEGVALQALTVGYERLFADAEVPLARLTASTLGIPQTLLLADDSVEPLPGLARALPEWAVPSPPRAALGPGFDGADPFYPALARVGRVALAGWDGDALLYGSAGMELLQALRQRELARLAGSLGALAWAALLYRRPPRTGVRGALGRALARRCPDPMEGYPGGILDPALQERLGLRQRWLEASRPAGGEADGPRARARATLQGPVWSSLFRSLDPGFTGHPVEERHPLLDLRLVRFFLGLPVVPWCVEKGIMRAYLRTRLPPAIWRRRKQGLQGDPLVARLRELPREALEERFRLRPSDPVSPWVVAGEELGERVVASLAGESSAAGVDLYPAVRLHTLNHWLKSTSDFPVPTPGLVA